MNDIDISELSLHEKALLALRRAVAKVVEEHRRAGLPLAVWREGKVVLISADDILDQVAPDEHMTRFFRA